MFNKKVLWCFWFNFYGLIIIHSIDMLLTQQYIGDNWEHETFPPMSLCIKYFGIDWALWISRFSFYGTMLWGLCYYNRRKMAYVVMICNLLYWIAMLQWLWFFEILEWPECKIR